VDDPHLNATGFWRARSHDSEGQYRDMAPPVRFSDAVMPPAVPPPNLDADGATIRATLTREESR
jgi:crotonobetainyl-CoA:carnitine CoA-transferase CaiB-like acyl-CoA transferase